MDFEKDEQKDEHVRILNAAMACIAQDGWADFTINHVHQALPELEDTINALYKNRGDVMRHFNRYIDHLMFQEAHQEFGGQPLEHNPDVALIKERLFALMMLRLDALQPYRPALLNIFQEGWIQTGTIGPLTPYVLCTLEDILFFAGLPTEGLGGVLMVQGLGAIYLSALHVWLTDDTEDLAKTMAHVDQFLSWGELILPYVRKPA